MYLISKYSSNEEYKIEENYLITEKVYNFENDVDMIYSIFFKKIVEDFNSNKVIHFEDYIINPSSYQKYIEILHSENILFGGLESSQLKDPICQKANKKLPIKIFCGILGFGSYYAFDTMNPLGIGHMCISINSSLGFQLDGQKKTDFEDRFSYSILKRFKNEVTEHRIKATISHELSHWIDNSEYNIFDKIIRKAKTPEDRKRLLLLKQKNVDMTYFEIQGLIHAINQIKQTLKNKYNELSLPDLFSTYTTLHTIYVSLYQKYGKDVAFVWLKFLLKRMNREGLLNNKMKFFSKEELLESSITFSEMIRI